MLERLSRGKRNAVLLVLALLVLVFAWSIRSVLNPLLLGYLCAFILHPLVVRTEALGFTRRTAVNLIFALGFLVATAILVGLVMQGRALALDAIGPTRDEDVEEVGAHLSAQERLQIRLDEFTAGVNERFGTDWQWTLPAFELEAVRDFLREHEDQVRQAAGAGVQAAGKGFAFLGRLFGTVIAIAGMFVLVPIYTYYFLFELHRIHGFVKRYFPKRDRERLARTAGRIGEVVASFFRGRLSVCLIKGVLLSIGLFVAGIDYAFLLGMLSGFLSVIPFFGPFLGFVLAFLVGMLGEHDFLSSLIRTGIVFGLGEIVEGYVLVPKILGDSLGLHPIVVFFALLAGGAALGMLGVLVALPLAAVIVIVVDEFVLPALRDFADEERV